MNKTFFGALVVLLCLITIPASAATVSFMMVETGLREDSVSTRYGSLWEGSLMDAFFNAGHIVTNSPITRMETRPITINTDLQADLDDAYLGGAQYFVLGVLEYIDQPGVPIPSKITIEIYTTGTRELIYRQDFAAGAGRTMTEEDRIAQEAGRITVSQIQNR